MCEDAELEVTLDRPPRGARIRRRLLAGVAIAAAAMSFTMLGALIEVERDLPILDKALAVLVNASAFQCPQAVPIDHHR